MTIDLKRSYPLDDGEWQMVVLALAHLAVERPGWKFALENLAEQFHGKALFNELRERRALDLLNQRDPRR